MINFSMPDNWQAVSDSQTILPSNKMCNFWKEYALKKIHLDQNDRLVAIIDFYICIISGKTVPDSQTITMKQNVWLQAEICPDACELDQFKNGHYWH